MSEKEFKNTIVNFGPQHPAAHGVLRLVIELDGEVVERAEPHIGQLHRGTEKLMEYKTYLQNLPFMDRLDYVAPLNYEHAYVLAIEKLLNCNVPLRAQYLRVIFSELSRISRHLFAIGALANDAGAMTPFVWGIEEREKIMAFFEATSGARMHMNYFRPGGVAKDVPEGLLDNIYNWTETFPKRFKDIDSLLTNNRIFKQRTVDIGIVSEEEAINFGIHLPAGEVYTAVETPTGEFGIYLVSHGGPKLYRIKLRSNGLAHLQGLKRIVKGYQLADVPIILGSLDVVFGEIDR
ncbi:UNVERIFIED_CONTAM: hypothetical protein PYX00_011175 [Menopon gallinae]|uniref:Complex I-49kD n=1 Tax=Menopon gallinae TaxID=328185 RepID=A0AAW2H6B2_9NEOP